MHSSRSRVKKLAFGVEELHVLSSVPGLLSINCLGHGGEILGGELAVRMSNWTCAIHLVLVGGSHVGSPVEVFEC